VKLKLTSQLQSALLMGVTPRPISIPLLEINPALICFDVQPEEGGRPIPRIWFSFSAV
jgi:hypothetical protein